MITPVNKTTKLVQLIYSVKLSILLVLDAISTYGFVIFIKELYGIIFGDICRRRF